jgi:hypothetical protein
LTVIVPSESWYQQVAAAVGVGRKRIEDFFGADLLGPEAVAFRGAASQSRYAKANLSESVAVVDRVVAVAW